MEHNSSTTPPQQPQSPRGTLPAFSPVPRERERSNGWSPQVQLAFIEALADTGSVKSACRRVNRSEVGAYLLRRHPEAESFRAAWQAALDLGMQRIEDVAMDRALNGVEVPVYSYGKIVGQRTVYNDRLLMFMLRNRAPDRFAEGRPKGLNAVGQMEQERLKKKWRAEFRAEWEAEQAANAVSPQEVRASIGRKVDAIRENALAESSPRTLAVFAEYQRLRAEDRANGYNGRRDPEHPLYEKRAGEDEGYTGPTLPDFAQREEPEEDEPRAEENPRWRSIKDDECQ